MEPPKWALGCLVTLICSSAYAEPATQPVPGISVRWSIWNQTFVIAGNQVIKTWLTRKADDDTERMDPRSFDEHRAAGQLTKEQLTELERWVRRHQEAVFALKKEYRAQPERYSTTFSLQVGDHAHTVVCHGPSEPAELTAAIKELSQLLEKVRLEEGPPGATTQPVTAWTKLYADEAWYRDHKQPEQVFTGTLQRLKVPEVSTLMRSSRYKLGCRSIYPGKEHPELEKLVGQKVQIKGKPYDVALEGQAVSEVWPAAIRPCAAPTTQSDIAKLITDLSSDDGQVRVAATRAIFALGKDALEPLAKAGAKQITPAGPASGRRIDMVYSLLDGLKPGPLPNGDGYHKDGFKLVVGKGCTVDDVKKMGERHGFTIPWNFDLNGHAFLGRGKDFAGTIRAILTSEPQVVTVGPEFFRITP